MKEPQPQKQLDDRKQDCQDQNSDHGYDAHCFRHETEARFPAALRKWKDGRTAPQVGQAVRKQCRRNEHQAQIHENPRYKNLKDSSFGRMNHVANRVCSKKRNHE